MELDFSLIEQAAVGAAASPGTPDLGLSDGDAGRRARGSRRRVGGFDVEAALVDGAIGGFR